MMFQATLELSGSSQTRRRTPLFDVALVWVVGAVAVALATGQPEVLALAAPVLVAMVWSIATWTPPELDIVVGHEAVRASEGDTVEVVADVHAHTAVHRVELELGVTSGLEPVDTLRAVLAMAAETAQRIDFPVICEEWGTQAVRRIDVRVTDRFGFFGGSATLDISLPVRVGFDHTRLHGALEADRFRTIVGSHGSQDRDTGMELADIRPWLPGDSPRMINPRISNRRQEPWVTLRHPDRSTTVVIIVDAHEGSDAAREETRRRSVLAALSLTRGHLALHDQVGLLVVGHTARWVPPRLGRNQLYRVADELVSVSDVPAASLRNYRPPAIDEINAEAIVVAVSPLKDPLMVQVMAELRSRGNPVVVLVPEADELSPGLRLPTLRPRLEDTAERLATIERDTGMHSLRSRGVVIVPWVSEDSITTVIDTARRVRSGLRRSVTL